MNKEDIIRLKAESEYSTLPPVRMQIPSDMEFQMGAPNFIHGMTHDGVGTDHIQGWF